MHLLLRKKILELCDGGRGTEVGEKDAEWGDFKSMLPISQLSHNSDGHLEAGWGEILMCVVWLPWATKWSRHRKRKARKRKDTKMEVDLKQGGRRGSAFYYVSWPEHQERYFHENGKFSHQSMSLMPRLGILLSCVAITLKHLTSAMFHNPTWKDQMIWKVMLWFEGYWKFSILFHWPIKLKNELSLSKSNITSSSSGILAGKATSCGSWSCALSTQEFQRVEWGQI